MDEEIIALWPTVDEVKEIKITGTEIVPLSPNRTQTMLKVEYDNKTALISFSYPFYRKTPSNLELVNQLSSCNEAIRNLEKLREKIVSEFTDSITEEDFTLLIKGE